MFTWSEGVLGLCYACFAIKVGGCYIPLFGELTRNIRIILMLDLLLNDTRGWNLACLRGFKVCFVSG